MLCYLHPSWAYIVISILRGNTITVISAAASSICQQYHMNSPIWTKSYLDNDSIHLKVWGRIIWVGMTCIVWCVVAVLLVLVWCVYHLRRGGEICRSSRYTCLVYVLQSHLWCKICSNTRLDMGWWRWLTFFDFFYYDVLNRRWCMWLLIHFSACYYYDGVIVDRMRMYNKDCVYNPGDVWCTNLGRPSFFSDVGLCCTLLEGLAVNTCQLEKERKRRRLGNYRPEAEVVRWWLLVVGAFILDK